MSFTKCKFLDGFFKESVDIKWKVPVLAKKTNTFPQFTKKW